jgi:Na+/glutamate symporter
MGLVTGIVAGGIVAMSLMLLDVTREEVRQSTRR